MSGYFDKQSIDIPCASGHKTKKTVGWIKANDHFTCASCGGEVSIDKTGLLADLKKVETQLKAFGKSFR